jgi:general secretion pathway protein D
MLTIEISQELSEAQANNVSNIDSPIILNRSITTSLVLKSGETVLLGGLISENRSRTRSEVPLLGDLPLVGNLFKVESRGNNKTELIVLITPYIINTADELKDITDALSARFR